MTYEKPQVEVVKFESEGFMTGSSGIDLSSAAAALSTECGGFAPGSNLQHFECGTFGKYSPSNPPQKGDTVTIGNGVYVFDYKGQANGGHWKCSVV